MRRTPLLILLAAGLHACRSVAPASATHDRGALTLRDTVSVLAAFWHTAAAGHEGRRATALHLPEVGAGFITSEAVRVALRQRGVPASERPPAGDDTVVFRLREWSADSGGGVRLDVSSAWTTVLGTGSRRCRTGSGNVENYRVAPSSAGWFAELVGPVTHGARACVPIP